MEHIKKFKTQDEFLIEKPNLPYPCVSFVAETQNVEYKTQSVITAKYVFAQEVMDVFNLIGLTKLPIYGNNLGSLKSYKFNGETHTFEEPIYEGSMKSIEFEEVETASSVMTLAPKFGYTISCKDYTTATTFTASRELDVTTENDCIIMCLYDENGKILEFLPIPLLIGIKEDIIILGEDKKSVSVTQTSVDGLNSYDGIFANFFFCTIDDIDTSNETLKQTPSIDTFIVKQTLLNPDKLFNKTISIQLSDIEVGKEYELKLVLSDSANSIGCYSSLYAGDEDFINYIMNITPPEGASDYFVIQLLLYTCASLVSCDLSKLDKEKKYIIPEGSFSLCIALQEIELTNMITSIGDGAFSTCPFSSITIPNSVTKIGDGVFRDCDRLTSITLGNSVTSIGEYAFEYCANLTEIVIPDSVVSIGDSAFDYCEKLSSLTFGKSVRNLPQRLFSECFKLKEIKFMGEIPESIDVTVMSGPQVYYSSYGTFHEIASTGHVYFNLGDKNITKIANNWDFRNWVKVPMVDLENTEPSIIATYNVTNASVNTKLNNDRALTVYNTIMVIDGKKIDTTSEYLFDTIGEHVVEYYFGYNEIASSAFTKCVDLTKVDIYSSVYYIGEMSFQGCSNLSSIKFNGETAPTIETNSFSQMSSSGTLYYPSSSDYESVISVLPNEWVAEEF